MAGQKNWEVDQNTTFSFIVEYKDPNDLPISLVGATAKLQVRDTKGGSKLAFTLTSPSTGGIVSSTGNVVGGRWWWLRCRRRSPVLGWLPALSLVGPG